MADDPNCHLDREFKRLRQRLLDSSSRDGWGNPLPELQRDMLEMLIRSLRSECLFPTGRLEVRPISLGEAKAFVARHHAHSAAPQGWKFGCGIEDRLGLVGVVVIGRPVARRLDDGETLEVTRLCTLAHAQHAASILLGAACRAAKALGYRRIVTYTRRDEEGHCCKAAGFTPVAQVRGRSWSCRSRPRQDPHEILDRIRWQRLLS
jgi:hypothetical protein